MDKNYEFLIHEIKNNVTLLQSSLQLIKKKHPEIKNYTEWNIIDIAFTDLSHLFETVSQKKTISELNMSIQPINNILTSFETHTQQLCSNAELPAPIFEHTITDYSSLSVSMNISLLERALLNLVQNAIDAMNDSASKTLLVRTYYDNKTQQFGISITDSGIGISKEFLNLIYTPSFTTKDNGLGFGLCIVKEIITAHNGILLCDSIVNQGTTFTILLPIEYQS